MKISFKRENGGYTVNMWFPNKKDAESFLEFLDEQSEYAVIEDVMTEIKLDTIEKAIKDSGKVVSQEQKDAILFWSDYDEVHEEIVLSPNKAGEITGKGGKQLQAKCKDRKIEAYQSRIGYWYIPLRVVLEML